MKTIHKYKIEGYVNEITTRRGARWLFAGFDPVGIPCVWAEVDTNQFSNDVNLYRIGTGHEIPAGASYVDSFVDGDYVWHVYAL